MSGEERFPALPEIGRPQLGPRMRLLDVDLSDYESFSILQMDQIILERMLGGIKSAAK